jgi:hypothetical protein
LAKLHNGYAPQVKALIQDNTTNTNNNTTTTANGPANGPANASGGLGKEGFDGMSGFLRHPTCANEGWVRSAVCPSLNCLASAHALATLLYHSMTGSRVLSKTQQAAIVKGLGQGGVEEESALFGKRRWHMGLQMDTHQQRVRLRHPHSSSPHTLRRGLTCACVCMFQVVGHEAFGGSLMVFYPPKSSSGVGTSIAITTNCLTLDKAATRQLLQLLTRELDLPMPSFATQGLFT